MEYVGVQERKYPLIINATLQIETKIISAEAQKGSLFNMLWIFKGR